jgi:hypothetical protein
VKNNQAKYIELGTQDGQKVTRHIDRDAIVGLAVTGQADDGAITIDATTAK